MSEKPSSRQAFLGEDSHAGAVLLLDMTSAFTSNATLKGNEQDFLWMSTISFLLIVSPCVKNDRSQGCLEHLGLHSHSRHSRSALGCLHLAHPPILVQHKDHEE